MAQIIERQLVALEVRAKACSPDRACESGGLSRRVLRWFLGQDPASQSYVRMKENDWPLSGIRSVDYRRSADI